MISTLYDREKLLGHFILIVVTVFIRISAQPGISAHLEQAPILKAEKVNKRQASNKRPRAPPLPSNQTQISAHLHPTHLSDNDIVIKLE